MDIIYKNLFERYNIIYIIVNIFYISTLTFYVVLEDDIFNKYYVMFLFIPIYVNYYTTYLKDLVNISIFINFIYIFTKLIFMVTYFNYDKQNRENERNYIIYSVVLYLLYLIEIMNMLHFYFTIYVYKSKYIDINNN